MRRAAAGQGRTNGARWCVLAALVGCAPGTVSVRSLVLSPEAPSTVDPLVAAVEASGPVELRWSVDGVETALRGETVGPEHTARGQVWRVWVEGDRRGREASVQVVNSAPRLTLTAGEGPWTADTPPAAEVQVDDADGDAVQLGYRWREASVREELLTEGPALAPALVVRGQSWTLQVVAADDADETVAALVFEVVNAPPVLESVRAEPVAPSEQVPWSIIARPWDGDGDPVTLVYRFLVDGRVVQEGDQAVLEGVSWLRGQVVRAEVQASDGVETSAWAAVEAVVPNLAPRVGAAEVVPSRPTRRDVLSCVASEVLDPDGDEVELRYTWWRGAELLGQGEALSGLEVRHGDVVWCQASGFDGVDEGVAAWAPAVRIGNAEPVLTAATIAPAPATRATALSVALAEPVDLDGDALYRDVRWFVGGVEVLGARELPPDRFVRGDVVQASVQVTDGLASSAVVLTPEVVVGNAPPEVVSAALSPRRAWVGAPLEVQAELRDADLDPVVQRVRWWVDGVEVAGEGAVLPAGVAAVGAQVSAQVWGDDGFGSGAAVWVGPAVVVADPVGTAWVEVWPPAPLHRDDLRCEADGDPAIGAPTIGWLRDGVAVEATLLGSDRWPGDRVPRALTAAGEQWTCTASWPSGPELSAVVQVEQGPPGGNLLLVVADDLGVDKVSAYGYHPDPPVTPTIDGLAAEGVLFRNAYAYPSCSPARAAMLTGRYGRRTGIGRTVEADESTQILSTLEIGLPELLGYSTAYRYSSAAVGKWHLGSEALADGLLHPNDFGFEHYSGSFGNLGGGLIEVDGRKDYFFWEEVTQGAPAMNEVYTTTDNVDDAIAQIHAMPEPWLLWLAFTAPHTPLHVPPAELHPYALGAVASDYAKYQAMVSAMDTELGRLLDAMSPEQRADTTIVFIGDNGTPDHATSAPFPAARAKSTLYEGGVRVPLLIAGPHVQHPGSEVQALVHAVDLLPTFAEIAGVPVEQIYGAPTGNGGVVGWPLDGASLMPFLADPSAPGRAVVYTEKFAPNDRFDPDNEHQAVRDERFKLVVHHDAADELFDLSTWGYKDGVSLLPGALDPVAQAAYDRLMGELVRVTGEMDGDGRP